MKSLRWHDAALKTGSQYSFSNLHSMLDRTSEYRGAQGQAGAALFAELCLASHSTEAPQSNGWLLLEGARDGFFGFRKLLAKRAVEFQLSCGP